MQLENPGACNAISLLTLVKSYNFKTTLLVYNVVKHASRIQFAQVIQCFFYTKPDKVIECFYQLVIAVETIFNWNVYHCFRIRILTYLLKIYNVQPHLQSFNKLILVNSAKYFVCV